MAGEECYASSSFADRTRIQTMDDAERLVREFFRSVWTPPHDLDAIDEN